MNIIFDFDSTLVSVESMDVIAKISLATHPDKEERIKKIEALTEVAMAGQLSFEEALVERVKLLNATRQDIQMATHVLQTQMTPSVYKGHPLIEMFKEQIYVISGGFTEMITPCILSLGLKEEHVYANDFLYDLDDHVTGIATSNCMSHDHGKVKQVQSLQLGTPTVIVGDGFTDYEIKAAGLATHFIAFTENVYRERVVAQADIEVKNFDELFATLKELSV